MIIKKEPPQPTSLTNIAEGRAWHIIDQIDRKHFFDDARKSIVSQFGDCMRLLAKEQQNVLCNFAARSVMRCNRYWDQDASRFADMFGELYWKLNPTEVRSLTPREARRLVI